MVLCRRKTNQSALNGVRVFLPNSFYFQTLSGSTLTLDFISFFVFHSHNALFPKIGIVFLTTLSFVLYVNNLEWDDDDNDDDVLITLDYDINTKIYITYFIYLNVIFLLLGTTIVPPLTIITHTSVYSISYR